MHRAVRSAETCVARTPPAARTAAGGVSRRACLGRSLAWALPGLWPAACSRADDSLQRLRQRGRIAVGYAVEPPYAEVGADGEVDGESPTAARRVAEALGLGRIDWVQTEFGRLIDELVGGRFDLLAAGLFVTEERRRRVHFSRPTLQVREGWLTRPGHPVATLSYVDARQRSGWRLVVLSGSVEERLLGERSLATVVSAPDARTAQALVRSGSADALALSLPTVRRLATLDPQHLVAAAAPPPPGQAAAPAQLVALAMRLQDHALHAAVDQALDGYLGGPRHLQDLSRFGLTAEDLPAKPLPAG